MSLTTCCDGIVPGDRAAIEVYGVGAVAPKEVACEGIEDDLDSVRTVGTLRRWLELRDGKVNWKVP